LTYDRSLRSQSISADFEIGFAAQYRLDSYTQARIGDNRMPGKPSFRVGDAVVVNPGVMDPDRPTLSLAGRVG